MKMTRHLRSRHFGLQVLKCGGRFPAVLAVVLAALPSSAQPTNRAARPDFSAFKTIYERNIFNPSRSAKYSPELRSQTRRPKRVDSVALVGTMSYEEQGPLAFFDGGASQYRKVLKTSDSIVGYKITDIQPGCIKLAAGTNEFELRVGMELRREDQGKWQMAERAELPSERVERPTSTRFASPPSGPRPEPAALPPAGGPQVTAINAELPPTFAEPPPEPGPPNAGPEATPGGSDSDVLARLMERRRQQTDQ